MWDHLSTSSKLYDLLYRITLSFNLMLTKDTYIIVNNFIIF